MLYSHSSLSSSIPVQIDQEQDEDLLHNRVSFYSSKYQIPLQKIDRILKHHSSPIVNSLHLAHNLTFVAQVTYKKIQHYSSVGVLLYEHNFNKIINTIFMANSTTVMMLLRSVMENDPNDEIVQLDLNNYEITSIPFKSQLKQTCGAQIFTESQLFCIKQLNSFVKYTTNVTQKVKLSYYRYPLKKQGSQVIESEPIYVTYFVPIQDQKSKMKIMKLNNKSMISLVRDNTLASCKKQFFIYNPMENKERWKNYFFDYQLKTVNKSSQFCLDSAWEIEEDVFYVKFSVYPDSYRLDQETFFELQEQLMKKQRSLSFTWKYKTKKRAIQPSSLTNNCAHFCQFSGQILTLDYALPMKQYITDSRLKKAYYARTRQYSNIDQIFPTQRQMPVYYINSSQKASVVTAIDQKKMRILLKNQTIQGQDLKLRSVPYSPLKYLEYSEHYNEQKNMQVLNIELKILKQLKYPIKMVVVDMLQTLIENCDDDLLYYVTEIIEDDNQISYHQIE